MEKKKNFECPKAVVIEFSNEDIMTTSGGPGAPKGQNFDDWGNPIPC